MSKLLDLGFDIFYILKGSHFDTSASEENEYDYIPCFDIEVSAGFGAVGADDTPPLNYLAFRKDWLKERGLYARNLKCVQVRGDSMEPTIGHKDTLLVNTAQDTPTDGQIYVIRSGDTLWVKRIQKQIDGSLLLISDNQTYPPMSLTLANHPDIQVIGQVVQVSKDLN